MHPEPELWPAIKSHCRQHTFHAVVHPRTTTPQSTHINLYVTCSLRTGLKAKMELWRCTPGRLWLRMFRTLPVTASVAMKSHNVLTSTNRPLRLTLTKCVAMLYSSSLWWCLTVPLPVSSSCCCCRWWLLWAVWRDVGMLMDSWGFFFGGAPFEACSSNGDTSISSATSGNTPLLRL